MVSIQFPPPFPRPKKVNSLVFCDFDETYFAHECTLKQKEDLYQLEDYLEKATQQYGLKIGWVTGSSIHNLTKKVKQARIRFSPHFICSDLGTEVFHVLSDGSIHRNNVWDKRLPNTKEFQRVVDEAVNELQKLYRIELVEQSPHGHSKYKKNYYYFIQSKVMEEYDLNVIKHISNVYGLGLNINRCNPKAGDPTLAYDIDFIVKGVTGKRAAAAFICDQYNIPYSQTIAFGDSGNDLELLKFVQRGYLVANATDEAKGKHHQITKSPYTQGILEELEEIFN
ncbi:HAD-IIB family hydrolase [Alkalicoccobacillus gibsonii]|uniref:HAD-IIB family hydrolase n=1 Tax=Alkalicoccobacillus gibsonii TaxID=79881 RepID=UPI0019347979|nr:HAD-IIB family hydrolase [Alkalicoccobacillus gibsonii]MBM0066352.1 HAD-IIB family hydrolase [Alkalicoccobacillus gibsonii]